MAIITISRGSYSHGKEIAQRVAEKLGYECVSREILIEASQLFNVSEMKLLKTIHDAPSVLERMTHGRERYLLYIRAALLEHIKNDNVVYHGHAGHLLIPELPNILKVRIIADMESRVNFLMEKERISRDEAVAKIQEDDKQRALWTRYIYGKEINDPMLYDLIIRIDHLGIDEACEIICHTVESSKFQVDAKARKNIADLALATHIKAALFDVCDAEVSVTDGFVDIQVSGVKIRKYGATPQLIQDRIKEEIVQDIVQEIENIVKPIPGVKEINCQVSPPRYA